MLNLENLKNKLDSLVEKPQGKSFLLAVSGGADSMVLANLFLKTGLKFQIAHVNYGLRDEDSDLDQTLVQDFCNRHRIKLHTYRVSEDEKPSNSIQIWARELRYRFFFDILEQECLDFIVTAHHLNDELETFFINLSRGSGIRGLSGIPENDNIILRPLLSFTKNEIYDFAEKNHIAYREDLSNKKNDYLRNKFRNHIIPEISEVSPGFIDGFKSSLDYLKKANSFIQSRIETACQTVLLKSNEAEIVFNKHQFLALEPFILKEIILKFGFRGDEIDKIISAENGKMFRSKTHELFISRQEIRCVPKTPTKS